LPQDPDGILGPKIPLDDVVTILDPKEEMSPEAMLAEQQQQFMQQAMAASSAPIMSAMMPNMAAAAAGAPMMDPTADEFKNNKGKNIGFDTTFVRNCDSINLYQLLDHMQTKCH
jgi:hypothetical protein